VETLQGAMDQVDQLRQTAESKVGGLLASRTFFSLDRKGRARP
jgi:hypothetical protein